MTPDSNENPSGDKPFELLGPVDGPSVERFFPLTQYHTNLQREPGDDTRVAVELLIDPGTLTYWAVVADVGVAAAGDTPAEAALAAMRAASALL